MPERTCSHWANLDPSHATATRRPAGADPEIGICQFLEQVVIGLASLTMKRLPETHATRARRKWTDQDGGGPDDGEHVGSGGEIDNAVFPFQRAA